MIAWANSSVCSSPSPGSTRKSPGEASAQSRSADSCWGGAQARTRDLSVYGSGDRKSFDKTKAVLEGFARAHYYVGEFERSGFFGPISRYRNHERDFEWLQAFKGRKLTFGFKETNDLFATDIECDASGVRFYLNGKEKCRFFVPLLGKYGWQV